MPTPIIFIHYGDSGYLQYTLESAVLFNPGTPVVLLGDATNARCAALGIQHRRFADYAAGPEIELFDQVYVHTAGDHHGRREWTRFVFRRWFHIYNFLRAHGIESFWTFDSDTLVLTRLAAHAHKFRGYDCTEQCSGSCMNGLVSSQRVVKGYLDCINALFQDEEFLARQRRVFEDQTRYAFTEMGAYREYRDRTALSSIRLDTIFDGESFVDSVCTLDEHKTILCDDQYEKYTERLWGHEVKKIYLRDDGQILMFHLPSQQFVRLNSLNMSWVPDALVARLLTHATRRLSPPPAGEPLLRELLVEECAGMSPPAAPVRPPRPKLPVTERLLDKLRGLRRRDGNNYPLY